jgi:vacuolar-type H+-ATPase subunit E/Vma4
MIRLREVVREIVSDVTLMAFSSGYIKKMSIRLDLGGDSYMVGKAITNEDGTVTVNINLKEVPAEHQAEAKSKLAEMFSE